MSRVGKRHIKPDLSSADCGVGGQIRRWAGGGAWDGDLGSVAEALSPCTGLAEPPGAPLPSEDQPSCREGAKLGLQSCGEGGRGGVGAEGQAM